MASTLTITGLDDLKKAIAGFGAECTDEAQALAEQSAASARDQIVSAYPQGPTGNLKRGVRIVRAKGDGHRALGIVKSTAPHAHLYEYGSRRQPARPVVGEVASRVRRQFHRDLIAMVERVTGMQIQGGIGDE